jgi:hypothetical protein
VVAAGLAGRRSRPAAPAALAWSLVVLTIILSAADTPLGIATRWAGNGYGQNLAGFIALLPAGFVGFVVARRRPGNPLGWLFLGLVALGALSAVGTDYAWLSYRLGHHLPLAAAGVILAPFWCPLLVTLPLLIVLFPDGRVPSPRWRPVLWGYLAAGGSWVVSVYAVTIGGVAAGHVRLVPGGDLAAVDDPVGSSAWLGSFEGLILPVLAVFWLAFAASQVLSWRRASGERRQQLKWLMTGAAVCMAAVAITAIVGTLDRTAPSGAAQAVFNVVANVVTIGIAALPVSVGVAILKYRLYDIDRIISRTLAYAIVTGLLVGMYAGLVLLATRILSVHTPVAVAASTLAAAALFNPVRRRVQRSVDRRFNRARYDADQMVARFAARLKDTVDLESVRDDLTGVVHQALEPAHVSVWINDRG